MRGHIGERITAENPGIRLLSLTSTRHAPELLHADADRHPHDGPQARGCSTPAAQAIAQTDGGRSATARWCPTCGSTRRATITSAVREVWVSRPGRPTRGRDQLVHADGQLAKPLERNQESEPDDAPGDRRCRCRSISRCAATRGAPATSTITICSAKAAARCRGPCRASKGWTADGGAAAGLAVGPPGPLPPGARMFDAGGPGVARHFGDVELAGGAAGADPGGREARDDPDPEDKALEKKSASHAALVARHTLLAHRRLAH